MVWKEKKMKVLSMDRTQSSIKMGTKMSLCIDRTRSNHLLCRKTRNLLYQHARSKVKRKSRPGRITTLWTTVLQATHPNPWKRKKMRKINIVFQSMVLQLLKSLLIKMMPTQTTPQSTKNQHLSPIKSKAKLQPRPTPNNRIPKIMKIPSNSKESRARRRFKTNSLMNCKQE